MAADAGSFDDDAARAHVKIGIKHAVAYEEYRQRFNPAGLS